MASLWDRLNELKNEHGDLSKYVNQMPNVFSKPEEAGETPEQADSTPAPSAPLSPTPETAGPSRRASFASLVSNVMSVGSQDNPTGENGETADKDKATATATPNGQAQTNQPPTIQVDLASTTDISTLPAVATVQPSKATNGTIPNGYATHKPAPTGGGGATGALAFSICTLILCPVSFFCTIPSCICAITAKKKANAKEPSSMATISFLITASFYVLAGVIVSFLLGGLIFAGPSLLDQLRNILSDIQALFKTSTMAVEEEQMMMTTMATASKSMN